LKHDDESQKTKHENWRIMIIIMELQMYTVTFHDVFNDLGALPQRGLDKVTALSDNLPEAE
jgi:hypothetical protein